MYRDLLFVLALLLLAQKGYGASSGLPVDGRFRTGSDGSYSLSLTLEKGEYIRGHVSGAEPLEVMISGPGGAIRQFSGKEEREARIHFAAPEGGGYHLVIRSGEPGQGFFLRLARVPLLAPGEENPPEIDSRRVQAALSALEQGQSVEDVWVSLVAQGTPLVEYPSEVPDASLAEGERLVTFLWRGARERVLLFGGPGYEHDPLFRLGDTDIWFRSYRLPAETRMSYLLAPDVPRVRGSPREQRLAILATAQPDPENPELWYPEGEKYSYSAMSVLELDRAPSDSLTEGDAPLPEPVRYRLASRLLGNTRDIDILVPGGLSPAADGTVPLIIFMDGKEYQTRVPAPRILDNLVREGRIPGAVTVFVSNPDRNTRNRELPCNEKFAGFMAEELLPFVAEQTGQAFAGETTLVAGASFGGLASACLAWRYPDRFGLVLSQSGSFWWSPDGVDRPEWLTSRLAESPALPVRFYLSAGLFETGKDGGGILAANRHLQEVLLLRGYDVVLEEFAAGHDYYHWRATLGRGLVHLLGGRQTR